MSTQSTNNPFRQLENDQKPAPNLKQKVMASTKFSYIVLYMLDLFVNKPVATLGVLFKTDQNGNDPQL